MKRTPLNRIPIDIASQFNCWLDPADEQDAYRLVAIRTTKPKTFEEQRLIALVVDENNRPLANVPVAFLYSTGNTQEAYDFAWQVPRPFRGDIVYTEGSGQIEHIQGSAIQPGQPGGVTVCVADPAIASDVIVGAGMLADHTGLHLTFQLQRAGVVAVADRLDAITERLQSIESRLAQLEQASNK